MNIKTIEPFFAKSLCPSRVVPLEPIKASAIQREKYVRQMLDITYDYFFKTEKGAKAEDVKQVFEPQLYEFYKHFIPGITVKKSLSRGKDGSAYIDCMFDTKGYVKRYEQQLPFNKKQLKVNANSIEDFIHEQAHLYTAIVCRRPRFKRDFVRLNVSEKRLEAIEKANEKVYESIIYKETKGGTSFKNTLAIAMQKEGLADTNYQKLQNLLGFYRDLMDEQNAQNIGWEYRLKFLKEKAINAKESEKAPESLYNFNDKLAILKAEIKQSIQIERELNNLKGNAKG